MNNGKPAIYVNSPELCKQIADDSQYPKVIEREEGDRANEREEGGEREIGRLI